MQDWEAIEAISIHAPREGSDTAFWRSSCRHGYFYPRSPRGERRMAAPASGMTTNISIHAPREGSDLRPTTPYT